MNRPGLHESDAMLYRLSPLFGRSLIRQRQTLSTSRPHSRHLKERNMIHSKVSSRTRKPAHWIALWRSPCFVAGLIVSCSVSVSQADEESASWGRGRRIFRSSAAECFQCHHVDPQLSNSDTADLSRLLVDKPNEVVARMTASHANAVPPVPDSLWMALSGQQQEDLQAYLTTKPPQMPLKSKLTAPPMRSMAEVKAALAGSAVPPGPYRNLKLILVAGKKDHGPGEHDYPAWQQQWLQLLMGAEGVDVQAAWEFPSDEQLADADVLLFFQKGSFNQPRPAKLDQFLKRGGGAVYIHWAVNGSDQVQPFSERIGMASWGGKIKFRHGPLTLDIHHTDHPIVRNFDQLHLYDESYWKLTGNAEEITLLATSTEEGMPTPQVWVKDHDPGRVFVSIPGHYSWTFDDPLFRILLLRGIAWTAKEPVDRFNDLVTPGARMKL